MDIVSYTTARNNLKAVLDKVVTDRKPTVIFRERGGSVVLIAKEVYDRMDETEYLMSTEANRERLLASIAEADAGNMIEVDPRTFEAT